jgi:heme-degrading monooxygenase HmoA
MLKSLLNRFITTIAIALSVLVLIGVPGTAQAATSTSISLADNTDVVNVVTVYPTIPSTQTKVLSEVAKGEQSTFSKTPGFQDSAILKAKDGTQVIALSQWKGKDLSSFQSYAEEHVLNVAGRTPKTFACQVQHTETRTTSPIFQQGDAIMFSQFKMKQGKDQSELAGIISQEMPGVLEMIPGLQWAAMCPSTNESTIALLARWNSVDDFQSLGQKPGFEKEANYWQGYADNEHGLYEVAQIIR